MKKVAIDKDALKVGEVLPWSIYDDSGRLLLSKGEIVASERQLATLQSRNLLRFEDEPVSSQGAPTINRARMPKTMTVSAVTIPSSRAKDCGVPWRNGTTNC